MELKIFLNKTYKNSANLISIKIKCKYFYLMSNGKNKVLMIDNLGIYSNFINSIEFFINGYKNVVDLNASAPLYSTNLEYMGELKAKNAEELNSIICNAKTI